MRVRRPQEGTIRRLATALTAAALVVSGGVVAGTSAGAATGIPRPSHDAFYTYDGSTPLKQIKPGTPLKSRAVTLAIDTNGVPVPATQILYRTTDATGHAIATVTTVVLPATGVVAPKVVAYLSFYDALSSKCNPSYTLRGGDPGQPNQELTVVEQAVVEALHNDGYIVTVPDFEGPTLDYVAGTESGKSSLDGIRATLRVLKLKQPTTPVGLIGYSGGSIAADWASELQPRYAPRLHIVGTAMGGIPANLAHNLRYIDGSESWSDVIPAAMIGISRSFHINFTQYLSKWGRKVVRIESHQCIGEFGGEFPYLTVKHLMKKRYADLLHIPVVHRIMRKLRMGSVRGHPAAPMLMIWGNLDDTGDGVMVAKDQQHLAAEYCAQGVPVESLEVPHGEHTNVGAVFFTQAFPWLAGRFAATPAPSTCTH